MLVNRLAVIHRSVESFKRFTLNQERWIISTVGLCKGENELQFLRVTRVAKYLLWSLLDGNATERMILTSQCDESEFNANNEK